MSKCKCTLQDAARARHCRYCNPQETIDELNQHIDDRDEDYEELEQEKDKEIKRIREEVKKAFWAGFEISHCLGGTDIQKKWNEYKDLKGLK